MRCILVLGPNRSGTSCVAQVLHNLSIPMTATKFFDNTYEDLALRRLFGANWREKKKTNEALLLKQIHDWIRSRMKAATDIWGAKHPVLCLHRIGGFMLPIIVRVMSDVKIIAVHRPKRDIYKSRQLSRSGPKIEGPMRYTNQFIQERRQILRKLERPVLHVGYYKILDNPQTQIDRMIDFCFENLRKPNEDQIKDAMDGIDPTLRHIHNFEIVSNTKSWRGFNPYQGIETKPAHNRKKGIIKKD